MAETSPSKLCDKQRFELLSLQSMPHRSCCLWSGCFCEQRIWIPPSFKHDQQIHGWNEQVLPDLSGHPQCFGQVKYPFETRSEWLVRCQNSKWRTYWIPNVRNPSAGIFWKPQTRSVTTQTLLFKVTSRCRSCTDEAFNLILLDPSKWDWKLRLVENK